MVGRGLTKIYRNGGLDVSALDGVDIDLFEGEIVVFLGESGSGKSTLLNSLGGLDVPTSGSLTYKNRDLTNASDDELTSFRRDTVGFVFQSFNLIPSLTARENVALTSEITRDSMAPEEALASSRPGRSNGLFSLTTLRRATATRGYSSRDRQTSTSSAL